ncbi:YcxB family protein [Terrimonas rubra]|jgi:hypothetical protein|uniref:YcxB family protein n=1 Tax=Terrimonas rubra TaxID=1035890 RepID=A0ABW6A262_9BACT
MLIKTKLSERDFINANLVMLYNKPFLRFATGLVLASCVLFFVCSFFLPSVSVRSAILPVLAISALPLATYFSAKKIFKKSTTLGESINYELDEDAINIHGESFTGQLAWTKVHKVTKTRNWLLIWQNSQQASPIPRRNVRDLDLPKIAGILNKNGVKNNL